ncbi:MAG: hypothetical protein V4489_07480 [Chlamydiota bacterium]
MDRQDAIKELVSKELISDQKRLVERLLSVYGIETNQVTVSRDLGKLGIIKKRIKGELFYELPSTDVQTQILNLALLSIEYNETMIVIKTQPALADFVGDCLDRHKDLQILGCLAGENTVFVAPKSIKDIQQVYLSICEKFSFKKKVEE